MTNEPIALYVPIALPRFTESARRLAIGDEADLREAETLLDEAWTFYERTHTVLLQIQVLCQLALVHRARGMRSRSLAILARAVELGRAGGFIRTFLDLGPDLLALLPDVTVSPAARDYLARILTAANASVAPAPVASRHGADRTEPLTSREVAVLELLAQHLSDKEIARSLSISPLTVRKHTANIFGKLQVHNRRQAAAKAIELGIALRSY
jgi:LuxR family maltose regulon positive regulatory protein